MRNILRAGNWLIGLIVFAGSAFAQKPATPAATTPQTATISGTVVSSDGTPLTAILTMHSQAPSIASPSPMTTSASNGSFQLSKIPIGTYQICATVQSGAFIDTCLRNPWGTMTPLVAGQSVAGQVITVQKAAVLQVRINDPQQLTNTQ